MRITIIEMSPEEFASLGTVEEVTDQVVTASPTPGAAGGAVSTCHGGAPQRRNDCDGNFWGEVKAFGQELWEKGDASLLDLVALTMEHFGLSTAEFARIIGANRSTVSRYLNHGQCREAVLLACTNFFGGR